MPNNGIPEYFPSLRYIERKNQLFEGILKAQRNQEGDTDTVTVYLFLAKYDVAFQNRQTKVYRRFPPSLPYIRLFTLHWTKMSY